MCVMATTTSVYVDPNTGGVQAGLMQFRNGIINGDVRINQRGTSTNLAAMTAIGTTYGYVCDRWGVYRTAYATGAQIGQGTDLTLTDLPFSAGLHTYGRIGRVAGNTSTNLISLAYAFESIDSKKYIGQKVTLSFYCRMGTSFSGSSLMAQLFTGTGTDEGFSRGSDITGFTGYSSLSTPISVNWIKRFVTVTLNNTHNQLGISFYYTPINTTNAGSSDYFDITGVQLELGSVATPFEVRPYPVELQLCQRYTFVMTNSSTSVASLRFGMGICVNATQVGIRIQHPVQMRVIPTSSTVGTFILSDTSFGTTVTSISVHSATTSRDATQLTVMATGGGLSQYKVYYLGASSVPSELILTAEL